jgi:hypothetical protein
MDQRTLVASTTLTDDQAIEQLSDPTIEQLR